VLGPATQRELRVPMEHRVRQIEYSMERLRWLPPINSQRLLVVNIPAFRLFAFDSTGGSGRPSLEMRVIVGKALDTRTPILFENLRYVEFRPYWNVPRSILMKEILPALRRRPDYLRANVMEIVGPRDQVIDDEPTPDLMAGLTAGTYRVRQRPGPANSLGLVKFVFPNAESVYLHGTPFNSLFSQARRDLSHGCIRLEDPALLAGWVLRTTPDWSRERIMAAVGDTATSRAMLPRPMPVIIFYTTVVAHPDGPVYFYPDRYPHDDKMEDAMRAGPTLP
jgi:murein L,D-transpeptidase YcbB/YkuD